MRSAKEITESLEIAKGLCEGKTNESWNARKAGRVMAELIAHFKKKEKEEQYDRVHKKGSGVGLVNVNNRIKILFGERYGLHIESELDEGTVVTIKIPAIVYSEENRLQFEEHHIV